MRAEPQGVLNAHTLCWPDYDGNGMFRSLGNLERLAAGWPQSRIDELLPENHVPAVVPDEAAVAVPQPLA